MSRIAILAFVIVVIAVGTNQLVSPSASDLGNVSSVARAQVSPEEITRGVGILLETKIESYEWVYPRRLS